MAIRRWRGAANGTTPSPGLISLLGSPSFPYFRIQAKQKPSSHCGGGGGVEKKKGYISQSNELGSRQSQLWRTHSRGNSPREVTAAAALLQWQCADRPQAMLLLLLLVAALCPLNTFVLCLRTHRTPPRWFLCGWTVYLFFGRSSGVKHLHHRCEATLLFGWNIGV